MISSLDPSGHFDYQHAYIIYQPHPEYVVAENPPW